VGAGLGGVCWMHSWVLVDKVVRARFELSCDCELVHVGVCADGISGKLGPAGAGINEIWKKILS